jgi:hypothetical protein
MVKRLDSILNVSGTTKRFAGELEDLVSQKYGPLAAMSRIY